MLTNHRPHDHVFYRNPIKYYPEADYGDGIYIMDTEGKRYIDGCSGAVVVSIGHGSKKVKQAMREQADRVAFTHGSQFTTKAAMDLAARLVAMAPSGLEWVYFLSGGSEAIETSIKMARQYQVDRGCPSKFKVISRWSSYHGNTLGALALSGHTGRRRYYQPLIQHTPHIAPAYCYRCPFDRTPEDCSLECAQELEKAILHEGPDSVSAFIAEPVVGATAGALVPKDGYFQRIRELCDQYDVLLIVDEVMTGIGRTGRNFGINHWGVSPDLLVCAKGLASGYSPLFCVMASEPIHKAIREGNGSFIHGHTYSQNPLSCAIALAVLDTIEENNLIQQSAEMGEVLLQNLQDLSKYPIVGDIRGLGLFAAVEFVQDQQTKATFDPQHKVSARITKRAFEHGLIVYPGSGGADGVHGDHILLAPPFIISKEQIVDLIHILDQTIAETSAELAQAGLL
jgi:adenosylmethionine-8-amino-7-oxononanoate aminotransferase